MTSYPPDADPIEQDQPRSQFTRRTALKGLAAAGLLTAVQDGIFLTGPAHAATTRPLPSIPPLPASVSGVRNPQIPVTTGWRYSSSPPPSFWSAGTDTASWKPIAVPGEPALQSQTVRSDAECAYVVSLPIPADFAGRRVLLRFDGVYNYARLWVNGTFVRDHDGGFTTWYADITSLVTPGRAATVTVGVTDRATSIAGQSDYAHHIIGGVLRDVTLVALPGSYLSRLHVDTRFDAAYRDATLEVTAAVGNLGGGTNGVVELNLADPAGRPVAISPSTLKLTDSMPQATAGIQVKAPLKWDAEHPNLYTLTATFKSKGTTEQVVRRIGFRQVEVQGNQLLVNGQPVHLLGVCHHSITEAQGRSTNASMEELAARRYKEANCNFVRTSHYPPTPAFLDWADKLGLYVEVEAPVCFQYGTVDDPAYTEQYMSQYVEMLERDRSHPSVIDWSLGNESGMGRNFAAENTYSHEVDPSRPTVFEDVAQHNGGNQADVYSGHYPNLGNANGNPTQPVQYGEFAHVPCYNVDTLRADPGVRDFWGHSIAKLAAKFRTTNGVVGGSIWAAIDEVFHLPAGPVGYGEWGIVDLWRRPKPEHWLTKKAFSPVQIADGVLTGQTPGAAIAVPVTNWHDHTNLGELTIAWKIGNRSGRLSGVDIAARKSGTLTVPAGSWRSGDVLALTFSRGGSLVDEYRIWLNNRTTPDFLAPGGTTPVVRETPSRITVTGVDSPFTVVFDKVAGRLVEATAGGALVLTGGPDLMLSRAVPGQWTAGSAVVTTRDGQVVVTLAGRFGSMNTTITVAIDGRGLLTTSYTIANPPSGAVSDVGISYVMPDEIDTLSWQRDGQWTAYPDDHIGRVAGTARKSRAAGTDGYRTQPSWPWAQDTHSYYLFGKDSAPHWTNDFRSSKANVRLAKATVGAQGHGVQVESGGTDSVRLARVESPVVDDASPQISYAGAWTHADLSSGYTAGDLFGTESFASVSGASAELAFTGTGVGFYSAKAANLGIVRISIDGKAVSTLDLYGPGKVPAQLVFRSDALPYGEHSIKIECTGEKNAASSGTYALVDAFRIVSSVVDDASGQVRYDGTWSHADTTSGSTAGALGQTESYSSEAGATARTTFRGTGIRVVCPEGPNEGIAEISVDGGTPTRVDLYAASKQFAQTVFARTGLLDGEHTVTVRVTGDKNPAATDVYVAVDAFDVESADPFASIQPGVNLITTARLNYPDLSWGNYTDPAIVLPPNYSATARLRLLA
ncbi:hypothetical protein JOF29_007290 [Kribbella aluminosa]|uniref:beta-galactosidase n=1 Tax=Kribbella aluminosa TaxID=416017 RepID=A0ABS4UX04_9ACTN|nr:glycoside hydrolase family 2 TIM barrel-domain containing protein [Kribbella aluminosa]MBP2356180.1 hypothetical protein [Kribbella aluminosa]